MRVSTTARLPAPSRLRLWIALAVGLAMLVLAPSSALAQVGVLDQTSPAGNTSFNRDASSLTWQQQFHVTKAGILEGVKLTLNGSQTAQLNVRIRKGNGPSSQPVLFSQLVGKTNAMTEVVFVNMTAAAIPVAVGDTFVLELQGNGTAAGCAGHYGNPTSYPDPLFLNGAPYGDGFFRIAFQSYVLTCAPGTSCDDGDACTTGDTCTAGGCSGSPVVCGALDGCHGVGTCNPATGMCSNPPKVDGASCDDGDACTQADTCMAGVCTPSAPIPCTPSDACHDTGLCDPATGMCSNPAKMDGATCDDGSPCSEMDHCEMGACVAAPVACVPPNECFDAGTCSEVDGSCAFPAKPDGTPCTNGTCNAGMCTPSATTAASTAASTTAASSSAATTGATTTGATTSSSGTAGGGAGGQGGGSGNADTQGGGCSCRVGMESPDAEGALACLVIGLGLAARLARTRRSRHP